MGSCCRRILAIAVLVVLSNSALASPALDDCWAKSENRIELGTCLQNLKVEVDEGLMTTLKSVSKASHGLEDSSARNRAMRTLQRSQMAFELYRDIECEFQELQAGSGSGSADFYLGCWIDLTRERIAALRKFSVEETANPLIGSWLVEKVGGQDVIDDPQPAVVFEADGKISGNGGCNSFFGTAEIDGLSVKFSGIGATRMACGEAVDEQESRFFRAIENAASFEFDQGRLSLFGVNGESLLQLSRAD